MSYTKTTNCNHKFEYNKNCKFKFIYNFLIKMLLKLKCINFSSNIEFEPIAFNISKIESIIYKNEHMLYSIYKRKAKYILVGRDYIDEIDKHITDKYSIYSFNDRHILGLQIIFIPYMEGIIILPDLNSIN